MLGDYNTNNNYFRINACEGATYANIDVYGEMMSFDIGFIKGALTFKTGAQKNVARILKDVAT